VIGPFAVCICCILALGLLGLPIGYSMIAGSILYLLLAGLDLALYVVFFLPGIAALLYAGWGYAEDAWRIKEHSNVTADGPPVYHFKTIIPIAGALVLIQGFGEIVRCIECLRTGRWPERLKDAEEIDVVEQQLAGSTYVDEESRKRAISSVHEIDEAARTRGMGADAKL